MLNATVRDYATRATLSVALAVTVVAFLAGVDSLDARQPPMTTRGHATLAGLADAIDGDTLLVGGIRVRLEGIDAPESQQICRLANGQDWRCGVEAHRALGRLVAGSIVRCEERGLDKYKRLLGVCRVGEVDINAAMVRRGLAWAFVRYSRTYVQVEAEARAARAGIWSGTAQPPWEYRADRWSAAEVGSGAPKGCPIKGNVTANGRIYHLPWSPWYGRIRMDEVKGKRWFCSEDEAIAAGWRAARAN